MTTAAHIRTATRHAQQAMQALDRETIEELTALYQDTADSIRSEINGEGDRLSIERLSELLRRIDEHLQRLRERRDQVLFGGLTEAATLGVAPFEDAIAAGTLTAINHQAVRFVREFTAADGLRLSDRLWRIDRGAREAITQHLQGALIRGQGAEQAARDFLRRGQPVPPETELLRRDAHPGRVSAAAADLMTGRGNALYQAERVFRTEINRAHGEAYIASALAHPDTAGIRFMLSPAHPKPDVCDVHASANLYGLGPGVYPDRASCPWPAHPNTMSFVEVVFRDEVSDADRAGREDFATAAARIQHAHG